MFIGHFAFAFGAKKYAPQVSLGILFLACQLADLIWPNLVLLGLEKVEVEPGITAMTPLNFVFYPYSHSLIMMTLWSVVFAGLYAVLRRAGTRAAIVVAVVGVSHWALDAVTHRADMPITFSDSSRIGLGLWNQPLIAVTLELLLFALGIWLYLKTTRPVNRKGSVGFWAMIIFLLVVYAGNSISPPPPSATAVAWTAQALWLLVIWGFWVDHHRVRRDGV